MNLDELTAVWRSQDAAPLHDVNRTLLHLALRKDDAKFQKQRRWGRWIVYVVGAGVVVGMALAVAIMIDRERATGWDFAILTVGAAAALLSGRAMYVNHRSQSLREQSFGESLRGQLNRSLAQLDDEKTNARRTSVLVIVLMGGICPMALNLAMWRLNEKSISDDGYLIVTMVVWCLWTVASGVWTLRLVEGTILPRQRRLEELLKELDGQ